jgi:hypothetical protein
MSEDEIWGDPEDIWADDPPPKRPFGGSDKAHKRMFPEGCLSKGCPICADVITRPTDPPSIYCDSPHCLQIHGQPCKRPKRNLKAVPQKARPPKKTNHNALADHHRVMFPKGCGSKTCQTCNVRPKPKDGDYQELAEFIINTPRDKRFARTHEEVAQDDIYRTLKVMGAGWLMDCLGDIFAYEAQHTDNEETRQSFEADAEVWRAVRRGMNVPQPFDPQHRYPPLKRTK